MSQTAPTGRSATTTNPGPQIRCSAPNKGSRDGARAVTPAGWASTSNSREQSRRHIQTPLQGLETWQPSAAAMRRSEHRAPRKGVLNAPTRGRSERRGPTGTPTHPIATSTTTPLSEAQGRSFRDGGVWGASPTGLWGGRADYIEKDVAGVAHDQIRAPRARSVPASAQNTECAPAPTGAAAAGGAR